MSVNELRLSQLLTTFGPGAMVDLPSHSVIIAGLDDWPHTRDGAMRTIDEPRLREVLEAELKRAGRLADDKTLELKEPPLSNELGRGQTQKVPARIFPEWFVCADGEEAPSGLGVRRRMVKFSQLTNKREAKFKDGNTSHQTTPIRFVGACKKGHLQDLNWQAILHPAGSPCREELYLVDRGTSGDPKDIAVECGCGAQIDLVQLYAPGRLGRCQGRRPWLGGTDHEGCNEQLHLLTRGAVNAYFAQQLKLISLPRESDTLTELVREHFPRFARIDSADEITTVLKSDASLEKAFSSFTSQQIFEVVISQQRSRSEQEAGRVKSPKIEEFDLLASGAREIGSNEFDSRLYAETLSPAEWPEPQLLASGLLQKIVRVHKLRAVSCLYGFTRLEPAPGAYDDGQDDLELSVEGAPLGEDVSWLPAMEQFGEGIFLQFSAQVLAERLVCKSHRGKQFWDAYEGWRRRQHKAPQFPGLPYVALHSLSHALMSEIALDCGYPSTALTERIYAHGGPADTVGSRYGILIFTSGGGAQGTLGGLTDAAKRIPRLIDGALDRTAICSNDPICRTAEPQASADGTEINGAACHGCLYVAETSCERRNMLLDRVALGALGA